MIDYIDNRHNIIIKADVGFSASGQCLTVDENGSAVKPQPGFDSRSGGVQRIYVECQALEKPRQHHRRALRRRQRTEKHTDLTHCHSTEQMPVKE